MTVNKFETISIPKFPCGFMATLEETYKVMVNTMPILDHTFGEDEEKFDMLDDYNNAIYDLVWAIAYAVVGGATINNPETHRDIYIFIINNLHLMNLDTQVIRQYGESIMKQGADVVPV